MKLLNSFIIGSTVLLLASCGGGGGSKTTTTDSTSKDKTTSQSFNGKIAFIRMDSLMKNYGMYIDMSDAFAKKQQQFQDELARRGRGLETEAMDLQDKAKKGALTRYQGEEAEKGLQKKQSDIVSYRDSRMRELQNEEAALSSNISKTVLEYLTKYNKAKGYSMILQTAAGSPVILADPSMDITNDVLAELNKEYSESLSKK